MNGSTAVVWRELMHEASELGLRGNLSLPGFQDPCSPKLLTT